jgi:DNA-binding response OmpR family regulator
MNKPSMRLLVIEDMPIYASLVNQLLAAEEACLDYAVELEDGVQKTLANPYDLVLLDLGLPDSQGLDTYLQFRNRCPAVPVVILSGLDDEQIAMQAVRAGAQIILPKSLSHPD